MPLDFDFAALRRHPDVEAENLFAFDASDRLILDEAGDAVRAAAKGEVVVIGDRYGALTLGAAVLHSASGIRTHRDSYTGENAGQTPDSRRLHQNGSDVLGDGPHQCVCASRSLRCGRNTTDGPSIRS